MNKMYKLSIFISFIFLAACSAPEGLLGKWEIISKGCLLKDKSGTFKDTITKDRKYILKFLKEDKVHLIYPDLDISADLTVDEKLKGKEKIKCDTIFIGSYSYTLFGNIQFDFANDETGAYQAKKGAKCETDLEIKFKAMPKNSLYRKDPSVSLEELEGKELKLAFSDFTKCEDEKMITIFEKK